MVGLSTFLPLAIAAAQPATPTVPNAAALASAVSAADARFFDVYFNRCNPDLLRTMVTDDFEMYHDRGGVVARSAEPFVEDYRRACTARAAPDAWRSRRELVASSLHVDPVPGFGAIEEGDHLFYERRGDGPERLAGRAHFLQLWQQTEDGWRLSRVFSYAHRAAEDQAAH